MKRRNFFKLAAGAAYLGPAIGAAAEPTPWIEQPETIALLQRETQQAKAAAGDIRLRDVLRLYGQGRENLDWLMPPVMSARELRFQNLRGAHCHYLELERFVLGDNAPHRLVGFSYIPNIQSLCSPVGTYWRAHGSPIAHYEFKFEDPTRPNFVFADGLLYGDDASRSNAQVDWSANGLTSDERAAVPRWDLSPRRSLPSPPARRV